MNPESLRALLQHRIEQAHETLREAKMTASDAQQFVAAVETYLRAQALI